MDESKMKEVTAHIKEHVQYPATKADIVAACNNMAHLSKDEKNMAMMLPEKKFGTADEVLEAMKAMM